MAKKSKNSKLLVHYTRTMTPENLSRAANYVGGYVLRGLGALGKIFTAPLTGGPLGPATVVLPKTKELLDAERKIRETQELLIGKAMTWVSPLNYGAALATGNGLNARKGEEEVASWSPAWLATARLIELGVGPKAVKGVKATPRVVINTAAKAGSKSAKKAVIARELRKNTKNTKLDTPNRYVTRSYSFNDDGSISSVGYQLIDPITGKPLGNAVFSSPYSGAQGRIVGWIESQNRAHGVSEDLYNIGVLDSKLAGLPGLESGWDLMEPLKTLNVTKKFPHRVIGESEGHPVRLLTGTTNKQQPASINLSNHYIYLNNIRYNSNTGNFEEVKPVIDGNKLSLKFFERKPSKLTEAEKFGLNKLDRKALSINELLALEDLALYKNSGQYRLVFRVTPDWENFGWNLDRSNPSFLLLFIKDGESMRGPWARVVLQTPTGKGVLAVNPEKNMAGYTSRSFPVPEGMNWAPGEANMMIDGTNGLKIILTAPRTDFFDAIVEKDSESIGEKLPNIIDKNIMKDFWINSRKALRPGTYLSGDNGHAPKGSELIEAFKKGQLHKVDIKERPLNKLFVTRTGLSPDSYSSIIRQGNRDGSLRWGEGFNKWNNSAVENRFINEAFLKLQKGEITPEQYEEIFNNWSLSIGGRELLWKDFNGNKIPIHPHPYIYAKKQGGKINVIEQFKSGGLIRKMQTASGGPINYKRWDDAKITSYTIPFIKEKAIKLTNAGRATGAVVSTNVLDTLADNAMRAGVPIRTAIAVSTKETTLGNPTDTKSAWNLSSGIRREFNGKYPGTHLHINPGRDLNERELVINYHKGHLSDIDTLGKSVILEALEFYKQHPDKYNTNQSDYQNLVNIIGEEVMKSPEVLKWYREWERSKAHIFRPEPYKINTNIQNTALEFIPHKKQGGKMNILEFLKNGSGIHIKEKNKGKFTSYCGGKVTDECILKGKNSSNPAIRKRATFAANARKWKHKEGGIIKASNGSNIFGKVGNFFLNNKLGLSILSTGINLGLNSLTNSANKNIISNEAEIFKANIEKNAADEKLNNSARAEEMVRNTLALLYDKDNPNAFGGDIVKGQLKLKFLNLLNAPIDQKLATLKALVDFLANQLKNLYNIGSLGGLSTDILNAFSNNKNSSSNNPSSGSYFGNHVNTLYKNYGTFNSDGSMNLGGELGTFSTTGGYKPRQYQMKTYTPLLKFSV